MQKTKMGISVGLLGSIIYFGGLFGGYMVALLLFGYVLLVEDNPWLRRTSAKSLVLLISFSVLTNVIGLIPDFISLINGVFNIFGGHFSLSVVSSIFSVITSIIAVLKTIVFIVLGLKALNQGTINIPVVDDLTNNNVE